MDGIYKLVIIGGGPAGFFSAITAAETIPELKISILEKLPSVLGKVKISGGGRCNVTNAITNPKELIKYYPRGGKQLLNMFYKFGSKETVDWFESKGVKLKTEDDGRIFPVTDNSHTIIDCLLTEAANKQILVRTGFHAKEILKTDKGWEIKSDDESLIAENIIVTTGSSKRIWDLIKSLGHHIIEPIPSLFTFNNNNPELLELKGISVNEAEIRIKGTGFESNGPLLITHWGFSGPAVLRLSAFAAVELNKMGYNFEIIINWLPVFNQETFKEALILYKKDNSTRKLNSFSPFDLPKRLWSYFLSSSGIKEDKNWNDISSADINKLTQKIIAGNYSITGKSTFKEEFVTAGGVDLSEINLKTMESKLHKGLFFAGEVLNIDGITGGFNFQSAWTTGYLAGASQKS